MQRIPFLSGIVKLMYMLASIVLWVYAGIMLYVWYFARFTPESAVLVRIVASILSDLVWVPLGFSIWFTAISAIVTRIARPVKGVTVSIVGIVSGSIVAILFVVSHHTAFALLFIPLIFFVARYGMTCYSGASKKRILLHYTPTAVMLLLFVFYYRSQLIPDFGNGNQHVDIKLMGYNIFAHADYEERMKVLDTIKHEAPDVLCLMEFNPMRDPELFERELGDMYPYRMIGDDLTRWTRSAAYILSRYPLKKISVEKISNKKDRHVNFIFVEMNVNGRIVNLVNYHLITVGHRIARAAWDKFSSREQVEKATSTEAAIDEEKYEQVQYLIDKISTFREPTILCGDLNDTPNSRAYHVLDTRFINTFSQKGWGLGSSFGKSWLMRRFRKVPRMSSFTRDVMRIDHIFVSSDFEVVSSKVIGDAEGSDHKPIVTELRFVK